MQGDRGLTTISSMVHGPAGKKTLDISHKQRMNRSRRASSVVILP